MHVLRLHDSQQRARGRPTSDLVPLQLWLVILIFCFAAAPHSTTSQHVSSSSSSSPPQPAPQYVPAGKSAPLVGAGGSDDLAMVARLLDLSQRAPTVRPKQQVTRSEVEVELGDERAQQVPSGADVRQDWLLRTKSELEPKVDASKSLANVGAGRLAHQPTINETDPTGGQLSALPPPTTSPFPGNYDDNEVLIYLPRQSETEDLDADDEVAAATAAAAADEEEEETSGGDNWLPAAARAPSATDRWLAQVIGRANSSSGENDPTNSSSIQRTGAGKRGGGGEWIRASSRSNAVMRRDNKALLVSGGGNGAGEAEGGSQSRPAAIRTTRRFCIYYAAKINLWHCQGTQMTSVPDDLSPKPISILFSNTGLGTLTRSHLEPYRETLRDFTIENAPNLTSVETNVFANWTRLRVFYIIQAPRLASLDFAIVGRHPDLTTIRAQQTGLRRWPDLSEFKQERILTSVDLNNNRIESLGVRPINIRAELVNLEFNLLTSIGEFTFNGSEIGALSLAGNRHLSFIHPQAFANLKSLAKLDLSGTSVAQLPAVGLHQLRSLIIRDNYALRQIPSIYVFPMLEEAHLTYAYHCCSFQYPKTHDPSAYEEHVRLQEQINAICGAKQSAPRASAQVAAEQVAADGRNTVAPPGGHSAQQRSTSTTTESSGFEGEFDTMLSTANPQLPLQVQDDTRTTVPANQAKTINSSTSGGGGGGGDKIGILTTTPIGWNIECGELVLNASVQNITCTPEPDAFNPCEDIMGYPVLRVAVWLVVGCSVMGNMSVIVVLLGIFRRLSVPKFLQLNLAIGDLVMGFYLAMLAAADLSTVGTYFNYAIDWQHGLGCRLAGASSLFASQLSIFTLIVITFERYYTITYTIDLNMRLQLGWAARIMFFGWLYAFAAAMLPVFGHINSYSKTSICLPMRTTYQLDRLFIIVLLVIDSCAFLIIFICYLRMYLLILAQKTEATLKERTVAMRMALLVLTDFACWAPIIFFGATAVFGHPLISVTNSKILIVFFYPLNSMANPFLYVLSTRQYRRDANYVLSRWRHWRKNLFKSQEDKDYSFNTNNPYHGVNALGNNKYPPAMYAHLGAVAAMTGVANHLHHYRVPLDCHNDPCGANGAGGQQVELIKLSNGSLHGSGDLRNRDERNQCNHQQLHYHHHRHHHHHHKRRSGETTATIAARGRSPCGCPVPANGRAGGTQYIIRHRILPERQGSARGGCASGARLVPASTYARKQNHQVPAILPAPEPDEPASADGEKLNSANIQQVKLGHVIGDNNERVSSLADLDEGDLNSSEVSKLMIVNADRKHQPISGEPKTANDDDDKSHLAVAVSTRHRRPSPTNRRRRQRRRCLCQSEQQLAPTAANKLAADSDSSIRMDQKPQESSPKRSLLRFNKTIEQKVLFDGSATGGRQANSAPTTTTEPEPTTTTTATISEIEPTSSTVATTTTNTTTNSTGTSTESSGRAREDVNLLSLGHERPNSGGKLCLCERGHECRHHKCHSHSQGHHHHHHHRHHRHRNHCHHRRANNPCHPVQSNGTSNLQVDQLDAGQQLSRSLDERLDCKDQGQQGDLAISMKSCDHAHKHRRGHHHRHHRRHHNRHRSRNKCRETSCGDESCHLFGVEHNHGADEWRGDNNKRRDHHKRHRRQSQGGTANHEHTPSTQTVDLATIEDERARGRASGTREDQL